VVSASAPANTADTNYRGNWSSSASYAGNDSVTDGGHQWEALTAIAAEQPAPSTSPATASQYLGYGESATAEIVGPGTYSGTMNAGGGYNSLDLNNADWYAVTGAPEQQFMPLLVAVPTLTGKHSTRLATGIHRMQAVVASLSVLRLMGVE
jgi:hypothetical protein